MVNFKKSILTLFCFSFIFTGCIVYPHATDVPLIKEKNDLRVDAGVSIAADASATVSYGLTEKIVIQGSGIYGSDEKRYLQGALGFYKNYRNSTVFEWYNGIGIGHGYANRSSGYGHLRGNYYLGFTQFNFGKVNSRFAHMDYGISLKTGYARTSLTDRNYFDYYTSDVNFDVYQFPKQKDNSILFQPVAFVRFGGEKLKFNIKAGGMWLYQLTNKDQKIPVGNFNAGISLNYYINLGKKN